LVNAKVVHLRRGRATLSTEGAVIFGERKLSRETGAIKELLRGYMRWGLNGIRGGRNNLSEGSLPPGPAIGGGERGKPWRLATGNLATKTTTYGGDIGRGKRGERRVFDETLQFKGDVEPGAPKRGREERLVGGGPFARATSAERRLKGEAI